MGTPKAFATSFALFSSLVIASHSIALEPAKEPFDPFAAVDPEKPGITSSTRTFTDDQGRSITATVISIRRGYVELRRDGIDSKTYLFPIAKLSAEDRAFLKQWMKEFGVFDLQIRETPVQSITTGGTPRMPARSGGLPSGFGGRDSKTTWEKSQYELSIRNNSPIALEGAQITFKVHIMRSESRTGSGENQQSDAPMTFSGSMLLPAIGVGKTVRVKTTPFDLFTHRYSYEIQRLYTTSEGGSYYGKETIRYRIRHQLEGITLDVKTGGRVVSKYQTEDRSVKPIDWAKAPAYSSKAPAYSY